MLKVVGASWYQTRIVSIILGTLVALGVVGFIFGEYERENEDGVYSATMFWSEDLGFRISYWGQGNELEDLPRGVARACYKPELTDNGWAILEIQSEADSPDWRQAYAAGFLEGSLSWQMIHWHWSNLVRDTCEDREKYCERVRDFLEENMRWVKDTAEQRKTTEPFWHQVHLFYMQLVGLENGFKDAVEKSRKEIEIPSIDFLWLNVMNDLVDLEQKFDSSSKNSSNISARGFSSSFIKLVPETRQLFVAHNSGGLYQSMLRMLKRYELHYHMTSSPGADPVPGQSISFSSYPGALHSQDDLYLVSGIKKHQLVIAGTAISNHNKAVWDKVQPQQILIGPRVMSANRLATSGSTWSHVLQRDNSGTGNKQWQIADYSRLITTKSHRRTRHQHGNKGLLWIAEQMPGFVRATDQTRHLLSRGFWAANGAVPFYKDISDKSLYQNSNGKKSDIFRRGQVDAKDLLSIQQLMSNDNVAVRGDLLSTSPKPAGTIDMKIILGSAGMKLQFHATAGPALSSDDSDVAGKRTPQPFRWSTSEYHKLYHEGQPDIWHFDTVQMKWVWAKKYEEIP